MWGLWSFRYHWGNFLSENFSFSLLSSRAASPFEAALPSHSVTVTRHRKNVYMTHKTLYERVIRVIVCHYQFVVF